MFDSSRGRARPQPLSERGPALPSIEGQEPSLGWCDIFTTPNAAISSAVLLAAPPIISAEYQRVVAAIANQISAGFVGARGRWEASCQLLGANNTVVGTARNVAIAQARVATAWAVAGGDPAQLTSSDPTAFTITLRDGIAVFDVDTPDEGTRVEYLLEALNRRCPTARIVR